MRASTTNNAPGSAGQNGAHTLGPWAITGVSMDTGNISVGSRDRRIVIADVTNAASFGDMLSGAMRRGGGGFAQSDCATQYANARLIAAAPQMLEALRELEAWMSAEGIDSDALQLSRAAIAAATGEAV